MKRILSLLFILLISSCGKKGEGSNSGVSPLLPAPVSKSTTTPTTDLDNAQAVIICVNTEFTHEEKIEGLKNYFITINDEDVLTKIPKTLLNTLIPQAVEALSAEPHYSKRCPKIYLAIE